MDACCFSHHKFIKITNRFPRLRQTTHQKFSQTPHLFANNNLRTNILYPIRYVGEAVGFVHQYIEL